jgi:hypothetical protein
MSVQALIRMETALAYLAIAQKTPVMVQEPANTMLQPKSAGQWQMFVMSRKTALAQAMHAEQTHSIHRQLSVHMEVMQRQTEHARQTAQTRIVLAQQHRAQEATGRKTNMHQSMEMFGGLAHGRHQHAISIALWHRH